MEFGLFDILKISGALAFFIYGMKVMSEGLQKVAGSRLRNILRTMAKNRFIGVFSGFLVTALLQSSSTTTVMVVSFANAGLLTLVESISVIMGANIGTTITAWLISIIGFEVDITSFALPLMAIGFPLLFVSRSFFKNMGEVIMGFAILFIGLSFLKEAVPDFKAYPETLQFLARYASYGVLSTILFVGIGVLLTIIVQSSSAAMALTLILLFNEVVSFEVAAAMVLGENIGTTITANLAALVGNVHAKRAARAHFIFNFLGVTWMILVFHPFIGLVKATWEPFQAVLQVLIPDLDQEQTELQLSLFHTLFNIVNTVLLIGLIPLIAKIAGKMVPSKGEKDEVFHLGNIGTSLATPELTIIEVQKEVTKLGATTRQMSGWTQQFLFSTDRNDQQHLLRKIKKYEAITDQEELALTTFLTKISKEKVTSKISVRIRNLMTICNNLENIGDVFYQMGMTIDQKIQENIYFNQHQRNRMTEMFALIDKAFVVMIENLNTEHYADVSKEPALQVEQQINDLRNIMRQENANHIKTEEDYNINSAMTYNNLFSSLEKVGDHIMNVTEAIVGEV